jgi:hypothetical protein
MAYSSNRRLPGDLLVVVSRRLRHFQFLQDSGRILTIGAGFLYDNGLLLCADTQFTAHFKLQGSKILRYTYEDGSKSVFVTVGHMKYARMCVQLIHDSISGLPKTDRSLSKMHMILVAGVRELYQAHLFKHPDRQDYEVQFLVGCGRPKTKRSDSSAQNQRR